MASRKNRGNISVRIEDVNGESMVYTIYRGPQGRRRMSKPEPCGQQGSVDAAVVKGHVEKVYKQLELPMGTSE